MWNLIADGMQAYNQIGLFVLAFVVLAIGGVMLGHSFQQRARGFRAMGTIIGVIVDKEGMFRPVYRYTGPDGEPHLTKSHTASNWVRGKETGRVVPLLISARNPGEAQAAGSYLIDVTGAVIGALGLWLCYVAFTSYPFTLMTWLMALALVAFLCERGYRKLRPRNPKLSYAQWRQELRERWNAELRAREGAPLDLADVKPIEQILADPAQHRTHVRNLWLMAVFLVLLATFMVGFGIQESRHVMRLEGAGLRAQGEVVRLQREDSSDGGGSVYHAVVRFRTDKNVRVDFKDRLGSNPPSYRRGDKVNVLYLPGNPQDAIIDRGFLGNWAIPVLMFVGAPLAIWLLIMMLRGARRRGTSPPPAVQGSSPSTSLPEPAPSSSAR